MTSSSPSFFFFLSCFPLKISEIEKKYDGSSIATKNRIGAEEFQNLNIYVLGVHVALCRMC